MEFKKLLLTIFKINLFIDSNWGKYSELAENFAHNNYKFCTPLSTIFFPEGGQVYLYPCSDEDSKKFIVDNELSCSEGITNGLI